MIEVRGLSKRYGNVEAVRDVSFVVESGQVTGLLGPNGAGKTTIMKILTCCHFPSGGTATLDGFSVEDDPEEVKKRVGYLPENAPLYGDQSVDEYLDFVMDARLLDKATRSERREKTLADCGLRSVRRRRIDTLSKGYRQRVALAQAVIHDPSILILDEPTTGLDPNQILEIRSIIRELGRTKTVIISTHILQEVEAVCSRVLILNEGRIAAQGKPEEIAAGLKGADVWDLLLKAADPASVAAKLAILREVASVDGPEPRPDGKLAVRLSFDARSAGGDPASGDFASGGEIAFDWAVACGLKIIEMTHRRVSLEDIFVKLTNEEESL